MLVAFWIARLLEVCFLFGFLHFLGWAPLLWICAFATVTAIRRALAYEMARKRGDLEWRLGQAAVESAERNQ